MADVIQRVFSVCVTGTPEALRRAQNPRRLMEYECDAALADLWVEMDKWIDEVIDASTGRLRES